MLDAVPGENCARSHPPVGQNITVARDAATSLPHATFKPPSPKRVICAIHKGTKNIFGFFSTNCRHGRRHIASAHVTLLVGTAGNSVPVLCSRAKSRLDTVQTLLESGTRVLALFHTLDFH